MPASAARETSQYGGRVMYVNMRTARGSYGIGRFVDGVAQPRHLVAHARCGLWAPSVVSYRGAIYLYAAENDCTGWHSVVLFVSRDGIGFRRLGVVYRTGEQLRSPAVVLDRGHFHLWLTLDRGGLGRVLAYAWSGDGRRFVSQGVKLSAASLATLAVGTVFRERRWHMLVEVYDSTLTRSDPYLVTFETPSQPTYSRPKRLTLSGKPAPKLGASIVCRRPGGGWAGIFTAYGAGGSRFGREWTVGYSAPRLNGPWRVAEPGPVLQMYAAAPQTSVENPALVVRDARVAVCGSRPRRLGRTAASLSPWP